VRTLVPFRVTTLAAESVADGTGATPLAGDLVAAAAAHARR